MERDTELESPERIERGYDSGLTGFFRSVGKSSIGSETDGDCVSYAAAFYDTIECDGLFAVFIPSRDDAPAPMHVVVSIDGEYYDGTGRRDETALIENMEDIFWSRWPDEAQRIDGNSADFYSEVYSHVEENMIRITYDELTEYETFSPSVYNDVKGKIAMFLPED